MSTPVHQMAATGFGTGTNELYDRARPSYRPEAIAHIRSAIPAEQADIIELGSGTGIFTRALLAHPSWSSSVKSLVAVEPSEGMRAQFAKTVKDERVSQREGFFNDVGGADGSVDAVIIAQAFHWAHPNYDASAREFARVLKPGGVLALIWNLEDREAAGWVAQLRDAYEQHEKGAPQFRLGLWRALYDTDGYKENFVAPEEETWAYALEGSLDIVRDRAQSKSYVAVLDKETKAEVVKKIEEIVEKGDGLKWVDKEKGIFEYPYKTLVVIARKK
ncbi:S-adenosyl-L-methionine-dependent methyltransferase [Peniophora sp. CONT]|nr:S-adenosyl-L-methionine-dependent methyltransferase [Peniophora sp. CONT]